MRSAPRVEQGLMRVVRTNPGVTEVALEHLKTALVRLGTGDGQAIETVVRLHAAIKDSNESLYEVPDEVQRAIDAWLESALSADHDDYLSLLRLAAIAGSSDCVPAEMPAGWRPAFEDELRERLHAGDKRPDSASPRLAVPWRTCPTS